MACCAFAAFLISQLYLGVMTLRRWLSSAREAVSPARRRAWFDFSPRRAVLALVLSAGALGVAYAADHAAHQADAESRMAEAVRLLCGVAGADARAFPAHR